MESEVQWITLGTITADTQQVLRDTNTAKDTKDRCPDLSVVQTSAGTEGSDTPTFKQTGRAGLKRGSRGIRKSSSAWVRMVT